MLFLLDIRDFPRTLIDITLNLQGEVRVSFDFTLSTSSGAQARIHLRIDSTPSRPFNVTSMRHNCSNAIPLVSFGNIYLLMFERVISCCLSVLCVIPGNVLHHGVSNSSFVAFDTTVVSSVLWTNKPFDTYRLCK